MAGQCLQCRIDPLHLREARKSEGTAMFTATVTSNGQRPLVNAKQIRVQQAQVVIDALASLKQEPGGFADHLTGEMNRLAGRKATSPFDNPASMSPKFASIA